MTVMYISLRISFSMNCDYSIKVQMALAWGNAVILIYGIIFKTCKS